MTLKENRPETVLVVDDNPTNLKLMFNLMEKEGFKVLIAADGEQGIRHAERARPDLILLDILMPGMDGFDACTILKKTEATKDIPVIFMTAVTDTHQKVKAFDLGAVDYITKPFQTEEVLARVRTQLALRRQMKLAAEKKKMETLLTLIGGIAHRFNNQLYVVKGNLDLMQGDEELPAKMNRFLEPAANAAEEIAELTRRLLIFTTYDRPEPEPTLLNRYISSRLATLKSTLPPGIRVETRFSEEDLPVRVDPSRMETVLSEIMENSREAMTDEKGLIRITTQRLDPDPARTDPETGEPFGPMARIAVADDGTGMDEATRERVFDPFFSTKFLGRGMSMAAVQGIVRGHGGFVSVISAPGRGTVVHLDLPLDGQSLS